MVAGQLRHPAVAKVIFGRRVLSVISLHQTDEVAWIIIPEPGRFGLMRKVLAQRFLAAVAARHRQVTGQNIVERRNISRTLDRGVTAQREDAATRPADVAEQQLQNRRSANDLNAFGMLRPTE